MGSGRRVSASTPAHLEWPRTLITESTTEEWATRLGHIALPMECWSIRLIQSDLKRREDLPARSRQSGALQCSKRRADRAGNSGWGRGAGSRHLHRLIWNGRVL